MMIVLSFHMKLSFDLHVEQKKALRLFSDVNLISALDRINYCIQMVPKSALNFFIQGRIYDELLDFEASIKAYSLCLQLEPSNTKARFYRGLARLTIGDFKNGFVDFGYRHDEEKLRRFSGVKKWTTSRRKGRVLIWAEQGIGDEIMFLRLAPLLKSFSHSFTIECDRRLLKILQFNYPWLDFVPRDLPLLGNSFDYQLPMGDLLKLFYKQIGKVSKKFLKVPENENIESLIRLKKDFSLIGLSWLSMNEEYGSRRSRPVSSFLSDLNPKKDLIINLQYLVPSSEIEKIRSSGFHVMDEIDCHQDIDSLFNIMSYCDKIMTIDNSTAHFAGALGLETQVFVPKLPNWRWGIEGSSSFWYPSIKLCRF